MLCLLFHKTVFIRCTQAQKTLKSFFSENQIYVQLRKYVQKYGLHLFIYIECDS